MNQTLPIKVDPVLYEYGSKITNKAITMQGLVKKTLITAIEIGDLLIEAQDHCSLNGIKWKSWVTENLPFSRQMAHNYRKIAVCRTQVLDWIETDEVKSISEALKRLRKSKVVIHEPQEDLSLDEGTVPTEKIPSVEDLSVNSDALDEFSVFEEHNGGHILPPSSMEIPDSEVDIIGEQADIIIEAKTRPLSNFAVWRDVVSGLSNFSGEEVVDIVEEIFTVVSPLNAVEKEDYINHLLHTVKKLEFALKQAQIKL
jgi:hypothetical protein